MTKNQLQFQQLQETIRSNKANEDEKYRSNLARETEEIRSNKATEKHKYYDSDKKFEGSIMSKAPYIAIVGNGLQQIGSWLNSLRS